MRILLAMVFLFSTSALAEYRAYRLILLNTETGDEKVVLSTFDHIQYKGYYYLGSNIQVLYDTSWMCWGNTSYHKPICPQPEDEEETGPTANSVTPETNPG